MDYELPTEFDLIIIGTGVVESIVSAAASRIGKRVLHIDNNNYYGGQWASFNLDSIQRFDKQENCKVSDGTQIPQENESIYAIGNDLFDIKDFQVKWHIPEKETTEQEENEVDGAGEAKDAPVFTQESLLKDSRKFNIDITPKLQFARGDFVELLISSNIARYSEYRSVSRVLTWLDGHLETVPCSRSDVFANNRVTVIEKRMLMKLFTSLDSDNNEFSDYENKTFKTFLKDKKLTPNLIHYVLYAIAMSTDETSCLQGIENTKRFLNSLGRFGKTPFLFSMYGSGEITQAFCRLSAVFGGIYALNQPLNGLIFSQDKFQSLLCGKQRISAENIVMAAEKAPKQFVNAPTKNYISRAVFITNKSIMEDEKEHLTLLLYPPEDDKNSCTIIELGTLTGTCPKNLYIVHLISKQIVGPVEDLQHCVNNLFGDEDQKPKILWSCYFSIPDINDLDFAKDAPGNVHICPGPDIDLDYDFTIKKAKDVFSKLYPDLEFLPRAPDPEEIIIEGDETVKEETDTKSKPEDGEVKEEVVTDSKVEDVEVKEEVVTDFKPEESKIKEVVTGSKSEEETIN